MGGEGTMSHANSSLRYNRGLVKKKNPFKKEWGPGVDSRAVSEEVPRPRPVLKKYRKAAPAARPIIDTGPDPANRFAVFMVILAVVLIAGYFGVFSRFDF